jgi:hypothetical protein
MGIFYPAGVSAYGDHRDQDFLVQGISFRGDWAGCCCVLRISEAFIVE